MNYYTLSFNTSANTRRSLRINNPICGISPVQRQIISKQVPHLPGPPDTISTTGIRPWAKRKGIAIAGVMGRAARRVDGRDRVVLRLRVYYLSV